MTNDLMNIPPPAPEASASSSSPPPPAKRGRPLGSIGRRSQEARAKMEAVKADPLVHLLRVVKNRRLPIETRNDAAKSLLPFLYPKLTAMSLDVSTERIEEAQRMTEVLHSLSPEQLAATEEVALRLAGFEKDGKQRPPSQMVIDVPSKPALSSSSESEGEG